MTTINNALYSLLGKSYSGTTTAASVIASLADDLAQANNGASGDATPTTIVTLSEQAKAFLASQANATSNLASVASTARAWFDQQYQTLNIQSAKLDGKTAVDLTQQSRATLSAVASNARGLFSTDEMSAATAELNNRFNAAIGPQAVLSRHNGNYATLYSAALDYLNAAGTDEKQTASWKNQQQAVQQGLAAARSAFGKAPDTGNADDPVATLLKTPDATATSSTDPIEKARAALDNQIKAAKDKGQTLVFNTGHSGQQADFSNFDNRMLATVSLNKTAQFAPEEVRAAKAELNQRSRQTMLTAFKNGGSANSSLALLKQYAGMSSEEKAALGVTDQTINRLVKSYKSSVTTQNTLGTSSGLSAYL